MFGLFERIVAFRYLRARRAEGFISVISWFSLLGIALGVATLIIVMAVMNGFRAELFGRILGVNGHLNVFAQSGEFSTWPDIMQQLQGTPGVTAMTPTIEGQALISQNGRASGVLVRGLRPEDFAAKPTLAEKIVEGQLAGFSDDYIAVGKRLAERLNLRVGGELTLISPLAKSTPFGSLPRLRAYVVGVIYDTGMYEYDNSFVFMPLPAAQDFFRLGEGITSLEIFTADPHHLSPVVDAIVPKLGPEYRLLNWQQNHASFVNALQVERNVMFLILTLIILVAAFNIISGMIMLVKDKTRDIAILRTMGASRGSVLRIFMLGGATVGVVGTAAGAALGIAFALNIESIRQFIQMLSGTDLFSAEIYFLSQLPAKIDWAEVTQVVVMALSLSLLATVYPAWRAARLDPVEALRYE